MAHRKTERNPLFAGRWFEDDIILLCLRWYFRFKLWNDLQGSVRVLGYCPLVVSSLSVWFLSWQPWESGQMKNRLIRQSIIIVALLATLSGMPVVAAQKLDEAEAASIPWCLCKGNGDLASSGLDQRLLHLTGEPLCRTRRSPVAIQINTNISIDRHSKEAATSALPRSPSGGAIHGFTLRRNSPAAFLAFFLYQDGFDFGFFDPVDLSTVVVAPTTCSLTTCLTTCNSDPVTANN